MYGSAHGPPSTLLTVTSAVDALPKLSIALRCTGVRAGLQRRVVELDVELARRDQAHLVLAQREDVGHAAVERVGEARDAARVGDVAEHVDPLLRLTAGAERLVRSVPEVDDGSDRRGRPRDAVVGRGRCGRVHEVVDVGRERGRRRTAEVPGEHAGAGDGQRQRRGRGRRPAQPVVRVAERPAVPEARDPEDDRGLVVDLDVGDRRHRRARDRLHHERGLEEVLHDLGVHVVRRVLLDDDALLLELLRHRRVELRVEAQVAFGDRLHDPRRTVTARRPGRATEPAGTSITACCPSIDCDAPPPGLTKLHVPGFSVPALKSSFATVVVIPGAAVFGDDRARGVEEVVDRRGPRRRRGSRVPRVRADLGDGHREREGSADRPRQTRRGST